MASSLQIFLLLVVSSCAFASSGVNISLYSLSVDEFNDIKVEYRAVLTEEAVNFCKENTGLEAFQGNLTIDIVNITDAKPNVNFTIFVRNQDDELLSVKRTEEMIGSKRHKINERTGQQITAANHEFFGIAPDNPSNWIIIAVFTIFTLALLIAAVYLSKHKVNHADEHYEAMKERRQSADGEIAT